MDTFQFLKWGQEKLKLKLIERLSAISKQTNTLKYKRFNFKNLQKKIYQIQQQIANFIKKRRTIKLLHLWQNYAAMAVVFSSSLLVITTNTTAQNSSSGFLFGYWKSKDDKTIFSQKKVLSSDKDNLAVMPLAKANLAVNVENLESLEKNENQESNMVISSQQGYMLASMNKGMIMKDPQEGEGVKIYEVKKGDTVGKIAQNFHVTVNTILWANDIENINSIKPGDKLFILPVAGLIHTVKQGETLDKIAKKYKANKDRIIAFNDLPANGEIKKGEEIIIPDGQKETPKPKNNNNRFGIMRRSYATPSGGVTRVSGWKKLEGKAGKGHRFPYGYCTWYVAQKRYVPWGGNAGTWLYHAKALGYKVGRTPRKGAIMVTSESWWGHVAIVEKVNKKTITVSEMNRIGWGKVSRRTLPIKSRVIKGFIY